jgi:hypothetical protein
MGYAVGKFRQGRRPITQNMTHKMPLKQPGSASKILLTHANQKIERASPPWPLRLDKIR